MSGKKWTKEEKKRLFEAMRHVIKNQNIGGQINKGQTAFIIANEMDFDRNVESIKAMMTTLTDEAGCSSFHAFVQHVLHRDKDEDKTPDAIDVIEKLEKYLEDTADLRVSTHVVAMNIAENLNNITNSQIAIEESLKSFCDFAEGLHTEAGRVKLDIADAKKLLKGRE